MENQTKYSKDYALGYTTALNHTKLALQDLVVMIDKISEEVLEETDFTKEEN